MKLTLGADSQARKDTPLVGGFDNYFPAAAAGVARHSKRGNDKHNPGQPLHWSRGKSSDHAECIRRHLADIQDMIASRDRPGTQFTDEQLLEELDALGWRALALSQEWYERIGGAPLAPAARLPAPEPKPGTVTGICGRLIQLHGIKADVICTLEPGHPGLCGARSPGARR